MAGILKQPITIDIWYGYMPEEADKARIKRLYEQLKTIERDESYIHPAPAFKITQDKSGAVHVKVNERMLQYLFTRFSELEQPKLQTVNPVDPPDWFMALMGNEPYEHLLPPEGAVI